MKDKYESFSNLTAGIQAIVVSVGVFISALWAYITFHELAETRLNISQAELADLEREKISRELDNEVVINTSIEAKQIGSKNGEKWLSIEVGIQNAGTKPIKIDFNDNTVFYVAKVDSVDENGVAVYSDRRDLKFDYQDKTITWVILRPGASLEKMHAIQKVCKGGVYLARISIAEFDDSVGVGREYSSDVFFNVN